MTATRPISFLPEDHAPPTGGQPLDPAQFGYEIARRLGHHEVMLTRSGRDAISALLQHLGLNRKDEVYIATTFDLPNVSSCVTCTIFNYAKPSRILTSAAAAILIIHEFGVPHPDTIDLRTEANRRGIPLIEDCAHTICSFVPGEFHVGHVGNWAIVSLPKLFPTTAGGMLVGPRLPYSTSTRVRAEAEHGASYASKWWPLVEDHVERRRHVFAELTAACSSVHLKPLFQR